jgi:hypothetical protein
LPKGKEVPRTTREVVIEGDQGDFRAMIGMNRM